MRILLLLLKMLAVGGVLALGVFLISREVLLITAVMQVKQVAADVVRAGTRGNESLAQCQKGSTGSGTSGKVQSAELAFISSTEYQVQVVCDQFIYEPVMLGTHTLPMFVTKQPGSAGFVYGDVPTTLTLGLWGRYRTLQLTDKAVTVTHGKDAVTSSTQPLTACSGFGYQCCQSESQEGSGEQITRVIDCPKSCFSQCAPRPVVLTFNTQPFFDPQDRTIRLTQGQTLTASYVVDSSSSQLQQVVLDYGDGSREVSSEITGTFTHTFNCATSLCQFQMQLTATTTTGVVNVASPISKVLVIVEAGP